MCNNALNLLQNSGLTIQQYKETVRTQGLINGMLGLLQAQIAAPLCEIQDMYNINLAVGVWLDRIGAIFGYTRPNILAVGFLWFGFDDNGLGFDQAPFNPTGGPNGNVVPIGDELYRQLLLAWIGGLFWDGTLVDLNLILRDSFGSNGPCYAIDNLNMNVSINLTIPRPDFYSAIVDTNVIPKPAGVSYTYTNIYSP